MLPAIALLLVCQLAGEVAARAIGLPVPGPVLGMVLLAGLLLVALHRGIRLEGTPLASVSTTLVGVLGLLFVPTGVGVVQQFGLIGSHAIGIIVTVMLSSFLTMGVTVGTFLLVKRLAASR